MARRTSPTGRRRPVRRVSRPAVRRISAPSLDVRSLPGPETVLRRELSNGIVVLARENFSSPSVVISGYLPVGSIFESRAQAGLADLTASALMRGTERWSFSEIYEQLESVGASLGLGAGKHATSFQGKSLAEDLGLLLDLLAAALMRPVFPEPQVERLRGEKLTALAIRDQDTGAVAGMTFDELAYPGHPYSLPDDGYPDTVRSLTVPDLQAFHRRHFGPRGMVLAVVGAVKVEAAVEAVERRLGGWHNSDQPAPPPLPPVSAPAQLVRKDVFLAGKSQCDVVIGSPGPSRKDPAYLAAALGNHILGRFGLMGRIGDAVRESAGLAYYAYSSIGNGLGPEPWQVVAGVNPANVERAVDLVRREIGRFVRHRVSAEELSDNQTHFIGRLPLQLESNEGVASALVHIERFDLGLDYYQRYPDLIRGVTRDHILSVARRFLDRDRLALAVAGPTRKED
ncbi:MAG: pitrilysin family protein [Chloroflexota bacterium]